VKDLLSTLPLGEDETKEFLEEPIAALPPAVQAAFSKVSVFLVPYLEKIAGNGSGHWAAVGNRKGSQLRAHSLSANRVGNIHSDADFSAAADREQAIGVVKAYTTRVGEGPFPTELLDKQGEELVNVGQEFGATTGRKRRCGWFDAELVRFATRLNGFTDLAITKLDVLDNFKELKICTNYLLNGKKVKYSEIDTSSLKKVKPVYKTFKGWLKSTKDIRKFDELPRNAQIYLKEIEKLTKAKISFISIGKEREAVIIV